MPAPVLSRRALNRATLARQHLLEPADMPVLDMVEHLGGLQAQTTHSWYIGLWARLERFEADEMGRHLSEKRVVRIGLHRSTIHLVTAEDCMWMRPLMDKVLERPLSSFRRHLDGIDQPAVTARARELLEQQPMTAGGLGRALEKDWPGRDPDTLAQIARAHLALVQTPPRGVWGRSGQSRHTTAEAWLGRRLQPVPDGAERLVLRYLRAFGPATPMDAQNWSGLTRLTEVFERLRPQLVTFADEDGRELFDLPDAPRPSPDTPAPVRFLYEYDNVLLGHQDRSRFRAGRLAEAWTRTQAMPSPVLVDGELRAFWVLDKRSRKLDITPIDEIDDMDAVHAEGDRLVRFLHP